MHAAFQALPDIQIWCDPGTGLDLSYRDTGPSDGHSLIFLHGFNGSSRSWAFQFQHYAGKARVLSIDFPGYGQSSPGDLRMDDVAGLVSRLMGALQLPPCIVVGHSMGGMLAQVLAIRHGERVSGLVLSCTHTGYGLPADTPLGERYTSRIEERQRLDDDEFGRLRIEKMVPDLKDAVIIAFLEDIAGEITVDGIRCGGNAMQPLDTTALLPGLVQPCLILTAELDRVVAPERAERLRKGLSRARCVRLAGVGHAPYAEDAEAFNRAVDGFLISL